MPKIMDKFIQLIIEIMSLLIGGFIIILLLLFISGVICGIFGIILLCIPIAILIKISHPDY